MDGWLGNKKKKEKGHDFLIIKLGRPGKIFNVDIDTSYFSGNQPLKLHWRHVTQKKNLQKNNLENYLK